MPPKKEPKETVFYPPSKQKAPPFKPLRPSTVPRTSTTDSESAAPKRTTKPPPQKRRKVLHANDDNDDESDAGKGAAERDSDASEDLPANPLNAKAKKGTKRATPKRRPARQPSPMSISSEERLNTPPVEPDPPPGPSQSDAIPSIPQPLLVRLLHEHFADKNTKIDKHAIQVLERYFEIFVRETIARAMARKKEEGEANGGMDAIEASWLELEDLEKVAAGMMLDF